MSGRLIITTKKTYCPWSQQNTERVLRDQRLEKERIEREVRSNKEAAAARRRRHHHESTDPVNDDSGQKHINLFPEAEEAELRLVTTGKSQAIANNGILPVPLGGEEASNRKSGRVPFYMQPTTAASDSIAESYGNGSTYPDRVLGRKVEGDVITGRIMRDQAVKREASRKFNNDPMMRFYQSGECRDASTAVATAAHERESTTNEQESRTRPTPRDEASDSSTSSQRHSKKKKHKRRRGHDKHSRRHKDYRHSDDDKNEKGSSDEASDSSTASFQRHSKKRRHKHKRRQKHDMVHSRRDERSNTDVNSNIEDESISKRRQKRLQREARENARAKKVVLDNNDGLLCSANVGDRERGYPI